MADAVAPSGPSISGAQRHRVLVVHAAYRQRGGEDAVAEAEAQLLERHGHVVERYWRHNDEVEGRSSVGLLRDTLWSSRSSREVADLIERFRPDVMHVHNSFPLISPSVYWAAHAARIPVVKTLHNFRLLCPQAMLLRDGRVCEDCVGRVPWRAVVHRCYRDSAAQSAATAAMLQTHRWLGTWRRRVTRFIALNSFCRDKLVEGGLPGDRIRIKPNFLELDRPESLQRSGILYVGRLSKEKGIGVLADAMERLGGRVPLMVAGSGPEAQRLQGIPGVEMLGMLAPEAVYRHMATAIALVVPSLWYEGHPRTVVEAFASGLPVLASRHGALEALVDEGRTGLLFEPGRSDELAERVAWAQANPVEMARMGNDARTHFESSLDAQANYRQLIDIYDDAIRARRLEG
jgi:glycosyltransferase involved in cell wall biosynthesis